MNLEQRIFVFGSNLAGRHGKGAAQVAVQRFGARHGQGEGLQGRAYALPTKDQRLRVLSLERIAEGVQQLCATAREHPELEFQVTRVGCGLAGYTDAHIEPLFDALPPNIHLPGIWCRHRDPRLLRLCLFAADGPLLERWLDGFRKRHSEAQLEIVPLGTPGAQRWAQANNIPLVSLPRAEPRLALWYATHLATGQHAESERMLHAADDERLAHTRLPPEVR